MRERVLALAAEPPETIRAELTQAGRWRRRRKRAKQQSQRPRRTALGELVQWDSSVHPWIEDRGPDDLVLVALHDDATSQMQHGPFVVRDTGAANRRAIIEYLERHGRPLAVYADHSGHFGQPEAQLARQSPLDDDPQAGPHAARPRLRFGDLPEAVLPVHRTGRRARPRNHSFQHGIQHSSRNRSPRRASRPRATRISLTCRSCAVPNVRSTRPCACGEPAKESDRRPASRGGAR